MGLYVQLLSCTSEHFAACTHQVTNVCPALLQPTAFLALACTASLESSSYGFQAIGSMMQRGASRRHCKPVGDHLLIVTGEQSREGNSECKARKWMRLWSVGTRHAQHCFVEARAWLPSPACRIWRHRGLRSRSSNTCADNHARTRGCPGVIE